MKKKLVLIGIVVTLIALAGVRLYKDFDKIKYSYNERLKAQEQIEQGKKIQKLNWLCWHISEMVNTPVSYKIDTIFRGKELTGNIYFTVALSNMVFNGSTARYVDTVNNRVFGYCVEKVMEIDREFFKNICISYEDSFYTPKPYCSEKKNLGLGYNEQ